MPPSGTAHLLQTKLYIPRSRPGLVPRPRLIGRLRAGLDRKLTLVSAPAGSGKTTLLSEWASSAVGSGVLMRIRDLGLPLVAVKRMRQTSAQTPDSETTEKGQR